MTYLKSEKAIIRSGVLNSAGKSYTSITCSKAVNTNKWYYQVNASSQIASGVTFSTRFCKYTTHPGCSEEHFILIYLKVETNVEFFAEFVCQHVWAFLALYLSWVEWLLALAIRPVGTNLILVRRVRANNLLSTKAERQMAWGPGTYSRAPGGVQGQSPAGGPAPPDALGF